MKHFDKLFRSLRRLVVCFIPGSSNSARGDVNSMGAVYNPDPRYWFLNVRMTF